MSRRGENIYKRKDGRWEGRYIKSYSRDGKACYGYVYAKTYKEVREKYLESKQTAELFLNLPGGRDRDVRRQTSPLESGKESLNAAAEEWLGYIRKRVKESTYIRYKNIIRNHIIPEIGVLDPEKIDARMVNHYADYLLEKGKKGRSAEGLSAKYVRDIVSILKLIMQYYSSYYGRKIAVIDKLDIRREDKESAMRVLSVTEQNMLCRYLREESSFLNLGILLSLFTGIRIGELCALKWKNIRLDDSVLYIRHTMQRLQNDESGSRVKTRILISVPKSKSSSRCIPIPEFMCTVLGEYKDSFPVEEEAYLLTGDSEKYIEPRTMQYRFKKVLQICGIEDANFHSLRHTFATRCVEAGFDIKSLSEILGHANVNITLNRYVHPSMELKRQNMSKLEGLM